MDRSRDAASTFYFLWRAELSAEFGDATDERLAAAASRLVTRGMPRSAYR